MKLGQQITEYINSLGIEEAAKTFDRAPSTVKTWLKTESYPMDVVEKFLETNVHIGKSNPIEEPAYYPAHEALSERVTAIENYLTELNNFQQQSAVLPNSSSPTVAWAPPEPNDGNFKSFVRPGQGVAASRTITTPAPVKDTTPSEHWLKARPLTQRN